MEKRLERLTDLLFETKGQLLAAQFAIRALIKIHPHPAAAVDAIVKEIETLAATGLASTLDDRTLDLILKGLQKGKKKCLPKRSPRR